MLHLHRILAKIAPWTVRATLLTSAFTCSLGLISCSDDESSDETGDGDSNARTFDDQVTDGVALYGENCAQCHGDAGQGTTDGPPVVGDDALPLDPPAERMFRTEQFETAADIFAFAAVYMPADAPGTLNDQEMLDVLAFALFANGVTLEEPLSTDNAGDIIVNSVE